MINTDIGVNSTIGSNIKKFREEKKLSRKDLSEILGISASGIANYENGNRIPSVNTLNKICKVLEVSVDDILIANPSKISKTVEDMIKEAKENILSDEEKAHLKNIDELSNYKELFFISRLLNSMFKNLDINLAIITNEKVAKLQLTDNKDGYTKIFNTLEEAETFFDEINHGIQSSVDRLKYYDKNNK